MNINDNEADVDGWDTLLIINMNQNGVSVPKLLRISSLTAMKKRTPTKNV